MLGNLKDSHGLVGLSSFVSLQSNYYNNNKKSEDANFGRTNVCPDRIFSPSTNTREEDHGIERQLHLLGSQRPNHLDLTVEGGAWMDRQS